MPNYPMPNAPLPDGHRPFDSPMPITMRSTRTSAAGTCVPLCVPGTPTDVPVADFMKGETKGAIIIPYPKGDERDLTKSEVNEYKVAKGATPGVHLSHVQIIDFGHIGGQEPAGTGAVSLTGATLESVVSHHAANWGFGVTNCFVLNCVSYKGGTTNFQVAGFSGEVLGGGDSVGHLKNMKWKGSSSQLRNNLAMVNKLDPEKQHMNANFRGQLWNTYKSLAHGGAPIAPYPGTINWQETIGNAAAASAGIGFTGQWDWGEGNVAHSNLVGITAPSEARHPMQDVTVWRAATFGIWTYNVHVDTHTNSKYRLTGPPLVQRVVVVDCIVGLYIAVKVRFSTL